MVALGPNLPRIPMTMEQIYRAGFLLTAVFLYISPVTYPERGTTINRLMCPIMLI